MFTNQVTTSMADFISKLNTFLGTTVGTWTTHHVPASGEFAARKVSGSVDIGFASQWDTTTPSALGIYQWHGAAYSGASSPWAQNDDSGNGAASTSNASLAASRHAWIGSSPLQFWCFEDDHYFHCVVQRDATHFVHFGAGQLVKFNDWTGGEYVYGHWQDLLFSGTQATIGNSTMLLDGLAVDTSPGHNDQELWVATMHVENLANQPVNGKYAVCMGNQAAANLGNDRQSTPVGRVHFSGGFRAGPIVVPFGLFRGTRQRGLNPMYPILPYYWDRNTSPTEMYGPMGQMPDVRGVNCRDYEPGDEVTIGSDTWVVFPSAAKATGDTQSGAGFSLYQGIAYKKVTA